MRRTRKKRKEKGTGASRAVLLFLAAASFCFGQAQAPVIGEPGTNATKSIVGTVIDTHGSPVPHAVVLLKDMKTLQIRSYIAQNDGSYHFYNLSGDINYQLRAQSNGLTSPQKTVSVFNSHKVVKLNLKLNKKLKT
jgi:Carboxypeptidase regulatory-like domain